MPYDSCPSLVFGLTQDVTCGGRSFAAACINASPVLSQGNVVFTPHTKVRVWLRADFATGAVVTEITAKSVEVDFGGGNRDISLVYDPCVGIFVAAN
jgi:hypothetical protein